MSRKSVLRTQRRVMLSRMVRRELDLECNVKKRAQEDFQFSVPSVELKFNSSKPRTIFDQFPNIVSS